MISLPPIEVTEKMGGMTLEERDAYMASEEYLYDLDAPNRKERGMIEAFHRFREECAARAMPPESGDEKNPTDRSL